MKLRHSSGLGSWVEIDLSCLRENYQSLRKKINPSTKIMAVVKADAYGHGLVSIGRELVRLGVPALGVGSIEEGIIVRNKISPDIPVFLLLGLLPEETHACLQYRLTPVLYGIETAIKLDRAARQKKIQFPVHIKIDTGMGRLGVPWFEFGEFVHQIKVLKGLQITGLTSHFGQADEKEKPYNRLQWKRFAAALDLARQAGLELTENHIANSAALLNYRKSHLQFVRPGILLYGCNPVTPCCRTRSLKVKPVMTLKSRILQVKQLPAGVEVSYGGAFITTRPESLAVIAIGYANGYPRILSNQGEVLIRGKRFPIVGRVCMNLTMIRVDPSIHCRVGEEVVLMGTQGQETITPDELAQKAETIPYELFCLLGRLNPKKNLGN
ncbi:MAG: alanine racemase [Thermodesulfobacteriota bacterium]|jgi:alanine racemase